MWNPFIHVVPQTKKWKWLAAIIIGVGALLGGCAGGDANGSPTATASGSTAPAAVSSTLRPAAEVRAGNALALGAQGDVDGLKVVVSEVTRKTPAELGGGKPSDPATSWALAQVKVSNSSAAVQVPPDFNLSCDGSTFADRYVFNAAGAFSFDPVPPGAFEEGLVLFGIPSTCPIGLIRAFPLGAYIDTSTPVVTWSFPSTQ
jgi:hypothetical protein